MRWHTFRAALVFYTRLPLSGLGDLDFRGIAAYAPLVGILIGVILSGLDWGLGWLSNAKPDFDLLRSSLVVLASLWLTGGLHFDGVIDTADGLAVIDQDKRLIVMADSVVGAYGLMAAIAALLLKVAALVAISQQRWWVLITASAWGRWGQLYAIAYYNYLKPEGKGKFHQTDIYTWQVWLSAGLLIAGDFTIGYILHLSILSVAISLIGLGSAWVVGKWLNTRLGGHTGDTYGATVEWAEVLIMVAIAFIFG